MTAAMALAVLAALAAAGGLAELAAAGPPRRTRASIEAAPRAGTPARIARSLGRLGRALGAPPAPADLDARLAAAGLRGRLTAGDLMAVKAGAALAALLAAVLPASGVPGRLGAAVLVGAPAAGFIAPDAWLRRCARARGAAMALELADVLDLLRLAVEAGLPVARALAEVGRRRPGPLAGELAAAATRIELGMPRAAAIGELVARCPVEGIAAFAAALDRADRHGTPLAPAVAAVALQARADHTRRLTEQAARAAPKIQLVIALLLVPGVMLLVAAALVATLT